MFKINKVKVAFAGLLAVSLLTLGYIQAMTWNETVEFLSGEIIRSAEGSSFLR